MVSKIVIAMAVAAAVGAAGGVVITHQQFASELQSLQEANERMEVKQTEFERRAGYAEERAERLDQVNSELRGQVASLVEQLDTSRQALAQRTEDAEPEAAGVDLELDASTGEESPASGQTAALAQSEDENRRRRGEDLTEEERAERREQWRARVDERINTMREELQEAMDARIQSANDPAARRRLAEIAEYSQDLFDWGQLIRDAEGEERDAYRQHMRETARHVRNLVHEQRDHMLRDLASQYGITDPQDQRAFLRQLERTQSDELFERDIPVSGRVMRGMRGRR